jgi:mRNA interferase MazF
MQQGDIFLANLNPVKGHEQAGYRPVLIIQNDILNKGLNTAVIIPITTNLKAKNSLITWFLPKKEHKLKQDSVALLFQIRTIDKQRLIKKVSSLKKEVLNQIIKQLRFIF